MLGLKKCRENERNKICLLHFKNWAFVFLNGGLIEIMLTVSLTI